MHATDDISDMKEDSFEGKYKIMKIFYARENFLAPRLFFETVKKISCLKLSKSKKCPKMRIVFSFDVYSRLKSKHSRI